MSPTVEIDDEVYVDLLVRKLKALQYEEAEKAEELQSLQDRIARIEEEVQDAEAEVVRKRRFPDEPPEVEKAEPVPLARNPDTLLERMATEPDFHFPKGTVFKCVQCDRALYNPAGAGAHAGRLHGMTLHRAVEKQVIEVPSEVAE